MAEARPNITIAPIRIDARIIVFLYSVSAVPRAAGSPVTTVRANYRPGLCAGAPQDPVLTPARDEGSALEPLD